MTNLLPRVEFLVQSLFARGESCPHCGSRSTRRVARKHVVVRVRECSECELCFTDPIYRSALGGRFYDLLYAAEGMTTRTPDRSALAELLRTHFAGTDKDFSARLPALRAASPGPRLLELGSSWGYFLHQARAAGFEATGLEIAKSRREYGARELGVRIVASFEELGDETFDLVYSAHVLEHFHDLSTVFDELRARLAPGGRLAIEVPRFADGADRRLASIGAVHPLGFSESFFRKALPRHGLALVGFYASWADVPERPRAEAGTPEILLLAARLEDTG